MQPLRDDPAPPQVDATLRSRILARKMDLDRRRQRQLRLIAMGAATAVAVSSVSLLERVRSDTTTVSSTTCAAPPPVAYRAGESLRASVLPAGFSLTEGSETDIGSTFWIRYTSKASSDSWVLLGRQQRALEPSYPGARSGSVHDRPALISDLAISWQATDSVVITVSARGLGGDELLRIANGVSYNPGVPATLTDADLKPRRDLQELETFYRRQLKGTIEHFELREMFAADLAAAAQRDPEEYPFPYWIGRPSDTVVVLLATGSLQADLPGTDGTSSGRAATALTTDIGIGVAASLRILPSLPEFLTNLPDRTPERNCQAGGDP